MQRKFVLDEIKVLSSLFCTIWNCQSCQGVLYCICKRKEMNIMFELKNNKEIGGHLAKLIKAKYTACRRFCIEYINLISGDSDDSDEIRKLENRFSQILKGNKSIQTYDLPIVSELLGVSWEQILSAGEVRTPISNRKTNYNIAFSKDERDWIEYINHEDCIASYADEFGKTVVDYAIECKNYDFLKFLIDKGYITLVSSNYINNFRFGADTTLKKRPYETNTLQDELYKNKILRTQIISLALENNDFSVLDKMKAREFPPQIETAAHSVTNIKFSDHYDEQFIETILHSKSEVIQYFCEEYYVESWQNQQFLWMFPFIDKLIIKAVEKNSSETITLLDAAIKHNEETYNNLKKAILSAAKRIKEYCDKGFQDIIDQVLSYFHISEEKNLIGFLHWYAGDIQTIVTNVIYADVKSEDPKIQTKIDRLNKSHSQIINIKDHLIKK